MIFLLVWCVIVILAEHAVIHCKIVALSPAEGRLKCGRRKNMKILDKIISINELNCLEEKTFFSDMNMMKAVVDIGREILAVNAELHSDLEQMLLENGSNQKYLYGINIYYDNGEIEFDSLINPPRNREAGYPRVGRGVADPKARERIVEVVSKWIKQ